MKRSLMFTIPEKSEGGPAERIVGAFLKEIRMGSLRPGRGFPSAPRLSRMTGESPADCLEATTRLIDEGWLRQLPDGGLIVAEKR